jgi:hypothetical protein
VSYHYNQLDKPALIRVFKLHPGKRNDALKGTLIHNTENIPYEALSYVWGSQIPRDETPHIEINGHEFPITKNLEIALRHLRYIDVPRTLWIDAICINQNDVEERNSQVGMMLDIYQRATLVNVWLGPSKGESSYGMQVLSFLSRKDHVDQAPWVLMPEQAFDTGFQEIISREWFSRMWVVQEAAVSKKAVMMCGDDKFYWSGDPLEVRRFIRRIKYAAISPQWEQAGLSKTNPGSFLQILNLQMQYIERTLQKKMDFPVDILDIAFEMRHRKASDRRDKLFSILGLVDPISGTVLKLDYNMNVEEVFERLLRLVEV